MLTHVYLLQKYGPLMTADQVGEIIGLDPRTIANQIGQERFPIPSRLEGKRRMWHVKDVAAYVDSFSASLAESAPASPQHAQA